jgi:TolB-like protein
VSIAAIVALGLLPTTGPLVKAQEQPMGPATWLWGFVDNVDGTTLTLDDGTTVQLTDNTKIIGVTGEAATPADITRGLRAEVHLDAEGSAARVELLPAPLAAEYYLSALTVRGATVVEARVDGRAYLRALSAIKAPFTGRPDVVSLQGGVAYQPPKEGKVPPAATFAIVNAANDVLFQHTVRAGEAADFKLNFPPGAAQTLTLAVSPEGEGALRPEWCLWLDPKLVAPLPAQAGIGVLRSTARALLADIKRALGETTPGPVAVALFGVTRGRDDQAVRNLQEDLVIDAMRYFQVVGKVTHRLELGQAPNDGQKKELTQMGAKCVLVGTISDRGEILVVNASLMDVESDQILATGRAWQ